MEQLLARNLRKLIEEPLSSPWLPEAPEAFARTICDEMKIAPAPAQFDAVVEGLRGRVMILTGGPGTGKTTTTRAILEAHLRCGRKVLLASPTGRAAKRLAEVTGQAAMTIHRLLEVDPKTFQFKRTQENPLECHLLIVDEVSMVDLFLAHSLIRALPAGLPNSCWWATPTSCPAWAPAMCCTISSPARPSPVVRLTEIFRQAATEHHHHQRAQGESWGDARPAAHPSLAVQRLPVHPAGRCAARGAKDSAT